MIRENFEKNMLELQDKMGEMVDMTVVAMEKAFKALQEQDMVLALDVIEEDNYIDDLENEINQMAIWLMAKEQPVARDMRRIISVIKMSSDIERIADFAVNTAKATIRISKEETILEKTSLVEMKNVAMDMLKKSMKAFIDADIALAKKVGELDDIVDRNNHENYALLTEYLKECPQEIEQTLQLLFINRFVERAADHITNMAESTAYFIKGQLFDLN
ncbi:phosphate signaling complex protein PhoU [Solibacillus sp. FSL W7-1472]|uniref:Phosphate-specific transport system accessory protein PhoU n=2 Tax=Solibacillus TaxID=648800 RepID=F2F7Y3_SOLSS|nr:MULTISPECIES: phosphate signaling complex protein PhoU [Solibacillus]AMO86009.1 phosphate transport system regulatory protein PhoU [Solibacillus silvestris]EKB46683.1 phosphate uptake regulator [Solibacillus isronensis B3W22]OBW60046.1 phosphate transport system regulatory protein PhoU [Solibacillus silvestris]BAK16076.1 phosphate uptake regulator [Solibacillus silvestris StLB046]